MVFLYLLACDAPETEKATEAVPTWHQDVAPIVARSCVGCHQAGGAAFSLETWADASAMASLAAVRVEAREMPPWGARETDRCAPPAGWKDDLRLSDEEIATFLKWAEGGAPEGDPATARALPEPVDVTLDDPDAEFAPPVGFAPSGDKDQFVCFVLDPGTDVDRWVTEFQFAPGNPDVVHHLLLFSDPGSQSPARANEDGWYDCFGDAGIDDAALLAAWAPGNVPLVMPAGAGTRIGAGEKMVMQVHYHPAGKEAALDQTKVQVKWTDVQPEFESVYALVGNASSSQEGLLDGPNDGRRASFEIPPDVTDHTETMEFPIQQGGPYTLWSMGTHMHYVGTKMIIENRHDDDTSDCLIETPDWDFDWQRGYAYDLPFEELPQVKAGDTLWMECTYDNTLQNPGVARALSDAGLSAPDTVLLGESTLDEMCLGVFGLLVDP